MGQIPIIPSTQTSAKDQTRAALSVLHDVFTRHATLWNAVADLAAAASGAMADAHSTIPDIRHPAQQVAGLLRHAGFAHHTAAVEEHPRVAAGAFTAYHRVKQTDGIVITSVTMPHTKPFQR